MFQLVIHIGVSGIAKELTLEQLAHNDGYDKSDNRGMFLDSQCCHPGAADCVTSCINMKDVCTAVTNSKCGVDAVVSLDPGRYG